MSLDPNTMLRLDGEVALVTGAARGIGAASAALLAAAGAEVIVADLDVGAAEASAATIRGRGYHASGIELDVTDEVKVGAAFDGVKARHGRLDVLVNNAGIGLSKSTTELQRADWDKVVAVNMTGVFLCAQAAARLMLAVGRGGRIVNIGSILGFSGGGLAPGIPYRATKGAVVNMTRALAVEWSKQGIRVNAIAPTYVKTQLTRAVFETPELFARLQAMTPLERFPEPDDIAAGVLFLASRASAFVTGHTLAVDSGFLAQ